MTANAASSHADVPTIRTLEEWQILQSQREATTALLLQCGSPVCTRCPDFTAAIERLKPDWDFVHVYVNTHDAEEDLIDDLQVSQLPAFFLMAQAGQAKAQAASPAQVDTAIQNLCIRSLKLDEDF